MTLTGSRVSLIHRMTTERDATPEASNKDPWGNPLPADWQPFLEDIPCRAWTEVGRGPRVGDERVSSTELVELQDRRVSVPLGTDILETDRVASITYRGETIMDGPMNILAVLAYPDHLEVALRRAR